MTETPAGRVPDGSADAVAVASGEPTRAADGGVGAAEEQPRPDLDQRQSRFSTERKPMGPPLEQAPAEPESLSPGDDVAPTDPTDPSDSPRPEEPR